MFGIEADAAAETQILRFVEHLIPLLHPALKGIEKTVKLILFRFVTYQNHKIDVVEMVNGEPGIAGGEFAQDVGTEIDDFVDLRISEYGTQVGGVVQFQHKEGEGTILTGLGGDFGDICGGLIKIGKTGEVVKVVEVVEFLFAALIVDQDDVVVLAASFGSVGTDIDAGGEILIASETGVNKGTVSQTFFLSMFSDQFREGEGFGFLR